MADILGSINYITVIIICIFAIPILAGIIMPLTCWRIRRSFLTLLGSLTLLASLILAVFLTRLILSGSNNLVLSFLYRIFPALENAVAGNAVWVHAAFITALTLILYGIMSLVTLPIRRYVLPPAASKIYSSLKEANGFFRRVVGGLWQLPRSLWFVLVFSLLLNFYTGFFNSPIITGYANTSAPYQLVQGGVIQPMLNTSVVKNIEVIVSDAFGKAERLNSEGGGFQLVRYINGMTLEDAVQSNADIDDMAVRIVGSETDDAQKARLLYLWICDNITYDNSKAAAVIQNPADVESGAVVAYTMRTGICFDFSCLYVAMCRAVDLKVRFIVGMGYSGSVWGDHAWNQVYYPKEERWINVDSTFGSTGINYFDREHFFLDHKDAAVAGEW